MKSSFNPINRTQSLNTLKHTRHQPLQTLAQKNLVSLRSPNQKYFINRPLRMLLPGFFNIPKFIDREIDFGATTENNQEGTNSILVLKQQKGLKKKLKDISVLAEGMKRAKNIREESRYYFIEGVILHNTGAFQKSIQMFEKFLKIVLFIKDDKSIELALNSIAIGYMYMNKTEEALQCHQKQQSLNENADNFVGTVNMALCFEMMKHKDTAYEIYTQLYENVPKQHVRRVDFLSHLMQRTRPQGVQNYFMTQNQKHQQNSFFNQNSQKVPFNQKQRYMYSKASRYSPKHNEVINDFDNSFMRRRQENEKVNFAIFNAEENLNGYLKDFKKSFILQQ